MYFDFKYNIMNNLVPKLISKFYASNETKKIEICKNYEKYLEYWNFAHKYEQKYKGYYIFMPLHCIGDLMLFCNNLKIFKKQMGGGKIVLLVKDKMRYDFVKSFPFIEEAEIIDESLYFHILFTYYSNYPCKIRKNKLYLFSPDMMIFTENIKPYNVCDLYKYVLNINTSQNVEYKLYPTLSDEENVNKKWQDMGLNDKTIFISPYATSLNWKVLSKDFWYRLAQKLTDKGYNVVFNAFDNDFTGYKNIFLPLNETGLFAKKCRASIMFRSGLVDIVALNNAQNLFVIYPKLMDHPDFGLKQREVWQKTYNFDSELSIEENIFNIMSLNSISGINTAKEIIFDGDEENLLNYFLSSV